MFTFERYSCFRVGFLLTISLLMNISRFLNFVDLLNFVQQQKRYWVGESQDIWLATPLEIRLCLCALNIEPAARYSYSIECWLYIQLEIQLTVDEYRVGSKCRMIFNLEFAGV